jgi:hypothetical protein
VSAKATGLGVCNGGETVHAVQTCESIIGPHAMMLTPGRPLHLPIVMMMHAPGSCL